MLMTDLHENVKQHKKNYSDIKLLIENMSVYLQETLKKDITEVIESCFSSWDIISCSTQHAAASIKMLADETKIHLKNILMLQFFDQLFFKDTPDVPFTSHDVPFTSHDVPMDQLTESIQNANLGHCLAYVFYLNNSDGPLVSGQTWDIDPWFTPITPFYYGNSKVMTHSGIFGGPFVSRFGHGVTWTTLETTKCQDGIPTPILLYELANNTNSIEQVIEHEHSIIHSASHGLAIVDNSNIIYLERNKDQISVTQQTAPVAHSNTYMYLTSSDCPRVDFSSLRIETIKQFLPQINNSKTLFRALKSAENLWINPVGGQSYPTQCAFMFIFDNFDIHYCYNNDSVFCY